MAFMVLNKRWAPLLTPTKPPCWPDDPDYLDGFTEIFLPSEKYLKAYWDCDIYARPRHSCVMSSLTSWWLSPRVVGFGALPRFLLA